ncbi:MAG: ribosomal protein S18-alanine N-acetyltransferase [Acidimicrobiaceae bacterium]|nr:ribosomal protein S18-alanine N-acetyltransferase [Acidimicrobiaceae bacterium]
MSIHASPNVAVPAGSRPPAAPAAPPPVIVPMRRKHLREIRRIDKLVYPRPWSMALYLDELQRAGERVYRVACTPGPDGRPTGVIGYGGFMIVAGEGHITSVAVHPHCQGQRVGARLMLELHREARRIDGLEALTLEARSSNTAAQRLYRWFGYAPVGSRKNYYQGGPSGKREDALVMWCHDIDCRSHGERLDAIATALGIAEGASDTAMGVQ